MQQDDYDLDSVTARLTAMEARRMKWQDRKKESAEQLSDRETASGFELAPADLSSGGSSDGEYESNGTESLPSDDDKAIASQSQLQARNHEPERGRKQKSRVTDSLDLSMSVEVSAFQAHPRHSSRTMKQVPHSKVQAEEHARKYSLGNNNNHAVHRPQPESIVKPSRIPKLVQHRRQIQAQRKYSSTSTHARECVQDTVSVANQRGSPSKGKDKTPLPPREILNFPEPPKPRSTGSPLPNKPKTKDSTPSTKVRATNHDWVPEEIASTTFEEQRLLESLEKLDRRLTNVSTPSVVVREGGQQSSHNEHTLKRDGSRTTCIPSTTSGCTTNGEIDDEIVRTAVYGGGSHCKSRQPSSVSVRSSSAKRAELSSGVHKARVRVGGALVNDMSRNPPGGGSGKHKIVVKKDLAHLLF